MNKASQVISFRLSPPEVQALQAQQQPGESLNQVAQRLLKNALGIPTSDSVNTVSTLSKEEFVRHQDLSRIPTRNEFHDLKEQILRFKLSLMREIQNRDKSIGLLAEQVAELTARLDAMPASGIDKETLSTAKETVLNKWRTAKAPEKKERIEQALDKFIDIVSPPETNTNPPPETVTGGKKVIDWKVGDKCSARMPSGVIITDAEVVSIQKSQGTCKVFIPDTGAHFTVELADLFLPSPDIPTDISSGIKRKKRLTAWEEWEQVCTDNIDDLMEDWYET